MLPGRPSPLVRARSVVWYHLFFKKCPSTSLLWTSAVSPTALTNCGGIFDLPKLQNRLTEVEEAMSAPDFWNNKDRAQQMVEEVSLLRNKINPML